jgi:hypothetical protein
MTQVQGKRRGQGEDSIYWDSSKNRYVGAVSQGFSPAGKRLRRKVTGRTKAEVRDKLRELHLQVDSGLRPRRRYIVDDALDDWLAHGLDGVSARTVTLYRGTIAPALRQQLGTVRLTDLTASDVQAALTAIAARTSTRTVQISHNVLVRAIRHAERDDLVARNVAALVKPPKGQQTGRPSKAFTLEQAAALMEAAKGTRLEAYIALSLLTGLRTEEARALRWDHVVAWAGDQWQPATEAGLAHEQLAVFVWRSDRTGGTPRPQSPEGHWLWPADAQRHCANRRSGKLQTGSPPGGYGRTTTWSSPPLSARLLMITMSGGSSAKSPRPPSWAAHGYHGSSGTHSCHCCPLTVSQSRQSHCWLGTTRPPPQNSSIGTRSCLRSPGVPR